MINRKKYETTAKLGMDTRQLSNNNVVTGQVLVQRGLNPFTRILLLHSVICPGMGQSMIEDRALGIILPSFIVKCKIAIQLTFLLN